MIPILRPSSPPSNLATEGQIARSELCKLFETNTDYRSGKLVPDFNEKLWKLAKEDLRTAQHNKCAFCESNVAHIDDGDAEHFRPKGGFQQRREDSITTPGYYWLAYEWTNLIYSCKFCNQIRNPPGGRQRGKGNLFPLRDPASRARSHTDDVSKEEPLLIDPCQDDPFIHLTFNREVAKPLDDRGQATIDIVGLDRPFLEERRRDKYLSMLKIYQVVQRGELEATDENDLRDWLRSTGVDTAEYAGMARIALKQWGL